MRALLLFELKITAIILKNQFNFVRNRMDINPKSDTEKLVYEWASQQSFWKKNPKFYWDTVTAVDMVSPGGFLQIELEFKVYFSDDKKEKVIISEGSFNATTVCIRIAGYGSGYFAGNLINECLEKKETLVRKIPEKKLNLFQKIFNKKPLETWIELKYIGSEGKNLV